MTDIAAAAREAAISLEAKKDGLSQRQDGSWLLRLRIHQNDDIAEIAAAPMGQRYVVALVALADNEEPLEPKKQNRLTQRACILCGELGFQNFLMYAFPMDWRDSGGRLTVEDTPDPADTAANVFRIYCGVQSRKEIVPNSEAAVAFEKLSSLYFEWLNQ